MLVLDATAVLAIGATALQLGTLNAAGTISFLLLGIPIGVLIDRHDARLAMIIAGTVRSIMYALLALVFARGYYSFGLLALVTLLAGILGAISEAGQTVWAAKVAPKSGVGALVAKMYAADNVVRLTVPAVAGLMLGIFAPHWMIAASAAISTLAALALCRFPFAKREKRFRFAARTIVKPRPESADPVSELAPEQPVSPASNTAKSKITKYLTEVKIGFAAFLDNPLLRRLTIAVTLTNFSLAAFSAVDSILSLRILGMDMTQFGFMMTFGAAAGIIGSLLADRVTKLRPRAWVVSFCVSGRALMLTLPLSAIAFPEIGFWLMGAFSFGWGLFATIENINVAAITAAAVPKEVLGRVSSFKSLLTFGLPVPIGSMLGGLIATAFSVRTLIVITLLITISGAIVAA